MSTADLLGSLVDYYTACLKYYGPLQYSFDILDERCYVNLSDSPMSMRVSDYEDAVRSILDRSDEFQRNEGTRFDPYYGHLLVVESKITKHGRRREVHPLILFPYRNIEGEVGINWQMPSINGVAVSILDNIAIEDALVEAELLTKTLRELLVKPNYDVDNLEWLDEIKPHWNLNGVGVTTTSISQILKAGLHRGHVLCLVEQSMFTKGLEDELQLLSELPELEKSALYNLLLEKVDMGEPGVDVDVLRVLPSNTEQDEAVKSALLSNLSVIQGPPGTGKSQVIAQLVMNAVHCDQTVLFVSKNNQAVDIVERRVNETSNQPVMLRIRRGNIREQVLSFLESSAYPVGVKSSERVRSKALLDRLNSKLAASDQSLSDYFDMRSWLIENSDNIDIQTGLGDISRVLIKRLGGFSKAGAGAHISPLRRRVNSIEISIYLYLLRRRGLRFDLDDPSSELISLASAELIRRKSIQVEYTLSQKSLGVRSGQRFFSDRKVKRHTSSYWLAYIATRPSRISSRIQLKIDSFRVQVKLATSSKLQRQQVDTLFESIKSSRDVSPFPAWSTTLLSLKRTTPLEAGLFDLVIFDEASQCDIASALPALARAKRAVVIGDPKQLSHITSHSDQHERALLHSYGLTGKDVRWSYTKNSLFDLVQSKIPISEVNLLKDHHRSHHQIIDFSNKYFYGGMLRSRTSSSKLKLPIEDCGVSWIDTGASRVESPSSGSLRNTKEARRVVGTLERLIEKYDDISIGVVTPFRAQSNYINKLIESKIGIDLRERVELRVGTVHTFQGDEKDIIIFSPVVAEGMTVGQTRFISQAGNLFNVAMTRARSKFIVVGDLIYARTNHIQFYSSFVEYIVNVGGSKSLDKLVGQRHQEISTEMAKLLNLATHQILNCDDYDDNIDRVSNYRSVNVGSDDFEAIELKVGNVSLYLVIDRLSEIISESKQRVVIDNLDSFLSDQGILMTATVNEVNNDPRSVSARLVDVASPLGV